MAEADEEQTEQKKDRQEAEQAKALDSVTDLVPERHLDEDKVKEAMARLVAAQQADKEAQKRRERELAAVKVVKEDVDLIAAEFELEPKAAERRLREANGVLLDALQALL